MEKIKFIENPKHIFECFYPPITLEDDIWYLHPTLPVYANSMGRLMITDPEYRLSRNFYLVTRPFDLPKIHIYKGVERIASYKSAASIIFEAYNDRPAEGHIYRMNLNPYDARADNLMDRGCFSKKEGNEYNVRMTKFIDRSAEEMLRKEKDNPGFYNDGFWVKVAMPNRIMKRYHLKKEQLKTE